MDRQTIVDCLTRAQETGCSVVISFEQFESKILRVKSVSMIESIPGVLESDEGLLLIKCWLKDDEADFGVDTDSTMILPPAEILKVTLSDIPLTQD